MKAAQTTKPQKRLKRVFGSLDAFIHLWAHQTQDDARCRNAFFRGRMVYSYGRHCPLGYLTEYKGQTVAFINNDGYSKTTSGHIYSAWAAVAHLPRFTCSGQDLRGLENGEHATKAERESFIHHVMTESLLREQDTIIDHIVDSLDTRCPRTLWGRDTGKVEVTDLVPGRPSGLYSDSPLAEYRAKGSLAGLPELDITEQDLDLYIELAEEARLIRLAKYEAAQTPEAREKREKAREAREKAELRKAQEKVEAWRRGEGCFPASLRNSNPLIRVVGSEVQTSLHASVPLSHALRALKLVESLLESEPSRRLEGLDFRLGHFRLNAVIPLLDGTDFLVIAGCHRMRLSEIQTVLAPFRNSGTGLELVADGGA